jgi:peptidoglycan/LPS O-acetylase OafA/YrhL
MLRNVQALRATAALLVVVVHLETLGAPLGLDRVVFNLFAVGVDLFFVISGFIMVYTTAHRPVSPGAFLLNRFLRIAPLYWLLTLVVFALALAFPALLGGTRADWDALLRSLAFIPYARGDGTMRPVLFVGWSLNLEMAFYLLFALALAVSGVGRRVALGVAMLAVAVSVHVLLGARLTGALRFLTQPILLEFAAGMVIAWLHPRLPGSRGAGLCAVAAGAIGLVALVVVARWPFPGGWPVSLPPACIVVLAALVAEKAGLTIGWRPVQALGDASYALYLTHPFVTQACTLAAVHTGLLAPATALPLMAVAAASAAVAGVIVHARIERPLGRWVRQGAARLARWHADAGLSWWPALPARPRTPE